MNKQAIIQELQKLGEDLGLETARFQEKAAANAGLSINDMRALSIIMRQDGVNATVLSKKLGVTNGAVTGIVERLRKKNLAHKEPAPHDQRSIVLRPNYHEIMSGDADYRRMGEAFHSLLESYTLSELETILDYNRRTLELTRQQSAYLDLKD